MAPVRPVGPNGPVAPGRPPGPGPPLGPESKNSTIINLGTLGVVLVIFV